MHEVVAEKRHEIEQLRGELPIRRLDLFGSVAEGTFDASSSDVDVLVEFDGGPGFDYFGTYFAVQEGLERILGRSVDVVSASSVSDPYFEQRVLDTGELLYAARCAHIQGGQ